MDQDIVECPVQDDSALRFLNNVGQNAQSRWRVGAVPIRSVVDIDSCAFLPIDVRSMNCVLHVGSVEVDWALLIGQTSGET